MFSLYSSYSCVMARGPRNKYENDNLGVALRWLRASVGLRQSEVASNASDHGQELSVPYYSECERGTKFPSQAKLDVILEALGTNRSELDELLDQQPWSGEEVRYQHYRSATTPPTRLRQLSAQPNSALFSAALASISHTTSENQHTTADHRTPTDKVGAEAAEIAGIYQATNRSQQLTMLAFARNLARRR
jgi:transcriptional regulator with XRE-family HTH domain